MASSWERRDEEKEERLYNALGAALNRFIDTELSVENGETPAQLVYRLPRHLQALQEAVLQRAQAMWRAKQ